MRKLIWSVFLAFGLITVIASGCAPSSLPLPSTSVPSPIPPTFTPEPTATETAIPPSATPVKGEGITIEGRVYRSDTDLGIANAVVTLDNADLPTEDPSRLIGETLSDEQGNYFFENLQLGKYSISVVLYPNKYNMPNPLPCNPPGGLFFFAGDDGENRFGLSGQTNNGDIILTISPFSVNIASAEIVHKDLDIYCWTPDIPNIP